MILVAGIPDESPTARVIEALDGIGYRGKETVGAQKLGAFIELHIEQGPILEAEAKTIGVVDHGQGIIWYDGRITGFESHAARAASFRPVIVGSTAPWAGAHRRGL